MGAYDTDILVWSEHQAELLRRRAGGGVIDEAELDWPNLAEEIDSVGRGELATVKSHLRQALLLMLKAAAWPQSGEVLHWQAEARRFRGDAADRFAPSMRQRIDMAKLYRRALRTMPEAIDGQPPLPLPPICHVTLDELLAED